MGSAAYRADLGCEISLLDRLKGEVTAHLPLILSEVGQELRKQHPDYADYLAEQFDEVLVAGRAFVYRLLDSGEDYCDWPCVSCYGERELLEQYGREHFLEHRDVTELLAAYRLGAAVAWRYISQVALRLGMSTEMVAGIASAVFAAVDQLSSASLSGFVHEQSAHARTIDYRRHDLAQMLLGGTRDLTVVRAAAAAANWALPAQAAVVLITDPAGSARHYEDSWLLTREDDQLIAIVPDPTGPGRVGQLTTRLRGCGAVIGPALEVSALPESRRLAEGAVALRRARVLLQDPLFVGEHLDWLVVHQDPRLLAELRGHQLRPLVELPEHTRERLTETLTAWLLHQGNHKATATALHVHPQTVRYRLDQLRDLFGPALEQPRTRAALLLALAWTSNEQTTAPHRARC